MVVRIVGKTKKLIFKGGNYLAKKFLNKKAFTLIEMTIVIGLVAILATMVYPNINDITDSAKKTVSDLNEKTIQQANIIGDALSGSVPSISRLADLSDVGDIQDITVSYSGSDNLYLMVSKNGSSWYSYRNELSITKNKVLAAKKLVPVNITDRHDIAKKAMSYSLFNDLNATDWSNVLNNSNRVSFSYYLEDTNGNDITKTSKDNIKLTLLGASPRGFLIPRT
jgi:prepilin-type N-terminal cleavage/methylation domain-containing protein